ncbi:MAG: sterile alpha motif-like domain-containing protein [Bacilli bacterium]|jgi:uncharacterized protein YozE (UPF0346 family)|nr:sterile alpha motif-like domain-containing protein [Bacilli bacterium]
MSFKEWLESFKDVEHPYTEIAKAVFEDKDFPHDKDFDEILDYVHNIDALDDRTMEDVIEDYKKYKNK